MHAVERVISLSRIIKASQVRQEDKLRELFADQDSQKVERLVFSDQDKTMAKEQVKRAMDEAGVILEQARSEAEEFLRQAETQVEEARQAGFEEGYREGVEQGFQAGVDQLIKNLETLFQNMERELNNAQMELDSQIQGLAPRLIRLSTQIAEKVVRREVQVDPAMIIDQVEQILKDVSRVKNLAIRVNPANLEIIKANEERFLALTQGIERIDFVIDHSLEPGGCVIETDSGGVDASIQTQLEMIQASLLEGSRKNHV